MGVGKIAYRPGCDVIAARATLGYRRRMRGRPPTTNDTHSDATLAELLHHLGDPACLIAPRAYWREALQTSGESLDGQPDLIAAFITAWSTFYRVSLLLDHLQDGDPIPAPWFTALAPTLQYQLIFSGYVDAQQRLAAIDPIRVEPARLLRLHQHWATCVSQIAEGQYRDLTAATAGHSPNFDTYEAITTQKTGAMFALAFGGVAILATTDEAQIAALTNAGLIMGMLLQYQDDRRDAYDQQTQRAVTADDAFWVVILDHYQQALAQTIAPLPPAVQQCLQSVVATFTGMPFQASADGKAGA